MKLISIALALILPVSAQAVCAPRDGVINNLATKYGETRQSIGLGSSGELLEIFASNDTGTWTIMVTNAAGMTCIKATGQAFEKFAEII